MQNNASLEIAVKMCGNCNLKIGIEIVRKVIFDVGKYEGATRFLPVKREVFLKNTLYLLHSYIVVL